MTASLATVQQFLRHTPFTGYQSVPLPHGLAVPGKDYAPRADYILGDRVAGRTLLDVGTYYGYFPHAAMARGATHAVGLEPDPERAAVAREIARLNGDRYDVVNRTLDDLDPGEGFDVVLFLRVLHHVSDPVQVLTRLAGLCREVLVIEFGLVDDPQYLRDVFSGGETASRLDRLRGRVAAALLRPMADRLPLAAVGNREYHRTWYFSRRAFYNLTVTHLGLFADVAFLPSSSDSRRHTLALCYPRAA